MIMSNNLEVMIAKAGMSKKNVASLKGITPETLSRHVHGKIQMTLQDAEQYAMILDCKPQDILFATKPVPILGYCHINLDGTITRDAAAGKKLGKVYLHRHVQDDTAAIMWSQDKGYSGIWQSWKNCIEFVKSSPMADNVVDVDAIMHESYVMLKNPIVSKDCPSGTKLIMGILYPEPGGTFTVHDPYRDNVTKSLEVEWATPVLANCKRPELRQIQVILDK
jgi:DNA-binding Xre family transcriptional regulator